MKEYTIEKLLDLSHTEAAELFSGKIYPWEVLGEIHDFILETGRQLNPEEYEQRGEHLWVAKSAKIADTACINGPAIIGEEAEIRHCAFIRGDVIVGAGAVVGNSTELKNCVLFHKVQVPHYNYVGDSILGYRAHMGAGSITYNVKSDKTKIAIRYEGEVIETGLKKMGAILGNYVEIGCNSVLNPGSIIGSNTNVYPLSMVRGYIPKASIYKRQGEVVLKNN